jgi:hypothetical protein
MKKISVDELKAISRRYKLQPCKIKGTDVVTIRKKSSTGGKYEDIDWLEFERILKLRGLAVYKAVESDFVKIMKK